MRQRWLKVFFGSLCMVSRIRKLNITMNNPEFRFRCLRGGRGLAQGPWKIRKVF
jgi:hypothetical protein